MNQHSHHSLRIPPIKGESAAGARGVSLWRRTWHTRRTSPYTPFKGGLGSVFWPQWRRPVAWMAFLKFITGMALSTLFFPISGSGQAREQQTLTKELEEIARVATIMVDGDVCQHIMTERALGKMFVIDPKDPWAGSDNFDVNAEPFIQTKKVLMRLARLVSYPVDCNLWMPFKEEPGKIQVLVRNQYEMSQFWSFGQLYTDTFPEMKDVLSTGKRLTVQKRKNIISVLAPVYNSLGDIVGLVEVVSQVQFNPQENVK
jgi:hypothetical protein